MSHKRTTFVIDFHSPEGCGTIAVTVGEDGKMHTTDSGLDPFVILSKIEDLVRNADTATDVSPADFAQVISDEHGSKTGIH